MVPGQGWAGINARGSVGHSPFWEPAQPPARAPAGGKSVWSVQDGSICPTASVQLSITCYMDMTRPEGHSSPSGFATMTSAAFGSLYMFPFYLLLVLHHILTYRTEKNATPSICSCSDSISKSATLWFLSS